MPLLELPDGRSLRLVPAYRHLGGMVSAAGSVGEAVAGRCATARVATAALRRSLLAQRSIEQYGSVTAAQACVHSRLLYLIGTWPELAAVPLGRWCSE